MKNTKNTKTVENFLTAKNIQFDTIKSFATARKQDANDKSPNAKKSLSRNTRQTSKLNDFIESLKSLLVSDVKNLYKVFIDKDSLVELFIESNCLYSLPCIERKRKQLLKEFNQDSLDYAVFVSNLKIAFQNHEAKIHSVKIAKLESMSDRAKAVYDKDAKTKLIAIIEKENAKTAQKAVKKPTAKPTAKALTQTA